MDHEALFEEYVDLDEDWATAFFKLGHETNDVDMHSSMFDCIMIQGKQKIADKMLANEKFVEWYDIYAPQTDL